MDYAILIGAMVLVWWICSRTICNEKFCDKYGPILGSKLEVYFRKKGWTHLLKDEKEKP